MAPEHQNVLQTMSDRGNIGLSFSGGGYRATAFSLGTMALLQDLDLLGRARVMSSVSGGSLALGAYLCAKAGANLSQEADFHFYERLWEPLMEALATEDLARALMRLPLLLDGGKFIHGAADETQRFLNTLLGQEARLGNRAITQMLRNRSLSPDYVFFNAANISSLDLFRFGIQRGGEAEEAEPVYVLNRYFLPSSGGTPEARKLYDHAKQLRLGDCVAASFDFPGGFEPLIFPDDYFRSDGSADDDEATEEACAHFRHSLICDRRAYVALLDGGLYDNLGLASVEDIRRFLAKRCEDLELRHRFHHGRGEPEEREQPIHYVIATDVDNIQPGLGFYGEPSLDQRLGVNQPSQKSGSRGAGRRGLPFWIPPLILVAALPLLGFIVGLVATRLAQPLGMLLVWFGVVIAIAMVVGGKLLVSLSRPWLEGIDLRQTLGLSPEFERQSGAIDLWVSVSRLLRELLQNLRHMLLRSPRRSNSLANLWRASQERRIGQLLPAFNGYLKRTRSLTYGYLEKSYEPADGRLAESQRCHLIRNMIFELQPGPDVDPAEAVDLITLPVRDYRRREDEITIQPIFRKLRHAAYARDLLLALEGGRATAAVPEPKDFPNLDLAMALLQPRQASQRDGDLESSCYDLKLVRAACLWDWLTSSLEMRARDPLDHGPLADHPNRTLRQLVMDVRQMLDQAIDAAGQDNTKLADALRDHCAVKEGEDAESYSWIPLICEMATNLSTTLWVKGFHWYEPNQLENQRIIKIGRWHVQEPPHVPGALPPLDLSISRQPAPAAMITALAGYMSSCFNLLEFFYASLGASRPVRAQLVHLLESRQDDAWSKDSLKQLADLPFALREAALREWRERHRLAPGDPATGHLALLEPWLTCRDRYPED
ncbi:patatin-like phospholipase family protein [Synechococcus sp. CS-1326]|nr:patatin-like phospholipase family protein [Synechococcus sp. CS-1326]